MEVSLRVVFALLGSKKPQDAKGIWFLGAKRQDQIPQGHVEASLPDAQPRPRCFRLLSLRGWRMMALLGRAAGASSVASFSPSRIF